jgi:AraC-like DNA-binding protein
VLHYGVSELRPLQPVLACCIPPLAWVGLRRSGLEVAGFEVIHFAPALLAVLGLIVQPYALDVIIPLLYLGYGSAILVTVARGADALPQLRLESGEQSGRIWRWIGLALIGSGLSDMAIAGVMIAGNPHLAPLIIAFSSSGLLLLMGALSLSRSLGDVPDAMREVLEPVEVGPSEADTTIMARLDVLVEEGRLYLDPDLTLSRLARRLGLPVKTLSIAINRVTGENVSRYINARRIKAACAALEAGESVTEAMLSAGFNTKSNFNREFLRITGKTPRAFLG